MNYYLQLIIAILFTALLGGLGVYAFYHSFKSYKNRDCFSELPGDFIVFSIMADLILWISKKFGSENLTVKIYRALTFCFGILMITAAALYWFLLVQYN
jgi:uncharacterized membrane-anchored protein